jgi:WD40 repeat protein
MIQFDGHPAPVYALAFSPDSSYLASADKFGGVRIWDSNGVAFQTEAPASRLALSWAPSGNSLVIGGDSVLAQLKLTNPLQPTIQKVDLNPKPILKPIVDLAHLSEDLLAVGGGIGVHLFDISKREARRGTQIEQKGVRRLTVHAASKTIAWITGEHRLRVWPTTSPDKLDVPLGKQSSAVAISHDGTRIAIGIDCSIRLYRVGARHPDQELIGHSGRASGAAFCADGKTLCTCSWDGTVRLWNLATGLETTRFPLSIGQLQSIAASPDGTRFAVGGTDGPIVLIDAD